MAREIKEVSGLRNRRTVTEALQRAAQTLLTRKHQLRHVVNVVEAYAEGKVPEHAEDLSVTFFLTADVRIEFDIDWPTMRNFSERLQRDAETGDLYITYGNPRIRLSWASFGNCTTTESIAVLSFYQEIAIFATQLELELRGEYVSLYMTKADEEAKDAEQAKKVIQDRIVIVLKAHSMRMRVGTEKLVENPVPNGELSIPQGIYDVEHADKRYNVRVDDQGMTFTRMA